MKNANTATASSSTCTAWAITSTSTRLTICRPVTWASSGRSMSSSTSRCAGASSGVPLLAADQVGRDDRVVEGVELLGAAAAPGTARPPRRRTGRSPHRTPPSSDGGDLPDLGVDEQERDEQQQHRQRPGEQRHQQAEAAERAAQRPAGDHAGRAGTAARRAPISPSATLTRPWRSPNGRARSGCPRRSRRRRPRATATVSTSTIRGAAEPGEDLLADVVDEVGQPVGDEPALARRASSAACRHRQAPRISRVRATSSCMVSTRASTPSNRTIPRSRSTNATSTSTP